LILLDASPGFRASNLGRSFTTIPFLIAKHRAGQNPTSTFESMSPTRPNTETMTAVMMMAKLIGKPH